MKKEWKLMDNAITTEQRQKMSNFILNGDRFSQGETVRDFEEKWSKWQGCKYSVFVNSGSSANFLATHAAMIKHGRGGTWVSQSCTWSTTVTPAMLSNNSVQLTDVTIPNLGVDIECFKTLIKKTRPKFLFLANLLGLPAVTEELLDLCDENGIVVLEDCCESHGATYKGKKVGNFGVMSTFSFYYGHHMTTIEGGMVCTDDEELYHNLLLLRSHGLLRELPEDARSKYEIVDPSFTFVTPGFNVRSTELNALLGIMQLDDLDKNISIRRKNFNAFVQGLDDSRYYNNFITEGNSSFCFPVVCKMGNRDSVRASLSEVGIETRPIIAGNLYEHPFMKHTNQYRFDQNSKIIHDHGFYIGNNQNVTVDDIEMLLEKINRI